MHLIAPSETEIRRIQERENAFYFSHCFGSILAQYGILGGKQASLGPGVVTRGFADVARLDPETPLIFEGPLSQDAVDRYGLNVTDHQAEQLVIYNRDWAMPAKACYQTLTVRTIPPPRSKEKPQILSLQPTDPKWRQDSFGYQSFEMNGDMQPILYATDPNGRRHVVGVQKGNRIFIGVPLLGVIVQHHTCPPIEGTSFYMPERYCVPYYLWRLFEGIAEAFAAEFDRPYLRVGQWPAGKKAAFCVRHDFDRPMDRASLVQLLDFYDKLGIKSTWFWRVCEANKEYMDLVASRGHEIALHTEREGLEGFQKEEIKYFSDQTGYAMRGYTAHGGRGSCGYLGQRQFEWAETAGLDYGELLVVDSGLPLQGVSVREELPYQMNLMMPGTHYSIDRGMAPEAYEVEAPRDYTKRRFERGEQIVIMNHPDIHLEPLKKFLAEIVVSDMWQATILESVRWTRQRLALSGQMISDGAMELRRTEPLDYDIDVWLEGARRDSVQSRHRLPKEFNTATIERCGSVYIT